MARLLPKFSGTNRRMATLTGDKRLDRKLTRLGVRAPAAMATAIRAGGRVIERGIRREAKASVNRVTGLFHGSIGSSFRKQRGGRLGGNFALKVGVNVGRKRDSKRSAPHAHLVILGTKSRERKRIGGKFAWVEPNPKSRSTGVMPPVGAGVVERGFRTTSSAATNKMLSVLRRKVEQEARRG